MKPTARQKWTRNSVHAQSPASLWKVFAALFLILCPQHVEAFSIPSSKTQRRYQIQHRNQLHHIHSASSATTTTTSPSSSSTAAQWHRDRRQQMLEKYGDKIGTLERDANSQIIGGTLLLLANVGLTILAILCGRLHDWKWTLLLGFFPGSIFSLWQLQILHDVLHGSLLDKSKQTFTLPSSSQNNNNNNNNNKKKQEGISKRFLQKSLLFWGSFPNVFGYYLYLQYGHLTHHQAVGSPQISNLKTIFDSNEIKFEDGDVLFVAHRMKLKGDVGPTFSLFGGKEMTVSISDFGFRQWRTGRAVWNMCVFATSFLYERMLLVLNDVVVAFTGKNFFFLQKPLQFHQECAQYCRMALLVRTLIWLLGGRSIHSLLFLYFAETLWSVPPHPASAMFVTNHGSRPNHHLYQDEKIIIEASPKNACIPSSSTYLGRWYSCLTLGTNYHCEHHDFPTIPFQHLGKLRQIAPEYYQSMSLKNDGLWSILLQAFGHPDFYACMNDMESIC